MNENSGSATRFFFLLGLVALWAWPSLFFVPVVLGRDSSALTLASAVVSFAVGIAVVACASLLVSRGSSRPWFIYGAIGVSLLAFVVVIPAYYFGVEAGLMGGLGGTRGEAMDIALERLLRGEYPYSVSTTDQQPLTPLPGGLLLAMPATVGLGSAAFLSAYLLPIGIFLVFAVDKISAGIAAVALVAAPALWTDYLSEGDLVATSFLAFALGLLVLRSASSDAGISRWIWPLLLGIVGATRVTTMVVAVLVAALLINSGRIRVALVQFGESIGVFLLLSVPFYLWNPDEFSPLHVSRFAKNNLGLLMVAVATVVLCVWLARSRWVARSPHPAGLALACSVFAFLATALPMLASLDTRADTGELLSGYAVLGLTAPIAVLALRRNSSPKTSPAPSQG